MELLELIIFVKTLATLATSSTLSTISKTTYSGWVILLITSFLSGAIFLIVINKYDIRFIFLNCFKKVSSLEQFEEWIGDILEEIRLETKNKHYKKWRINLLYIRKFVVLIYSAIFIYMANYIGNWLASFKVWK